MDAGGAAVQVPELEWDRGGDGHCSPLLVVSVNVPLFEHPDCHHETGARRPPSATWANSMAGHFTHTGSDTRLSADLVILYD